MLRRFLPSRREASLFPAAPTPHKHLHDVLGLNEDEWKERKARFGELVQLGEAALCGYVHEHPGEMDDIVVFLFATREAPVAWQWTLWLLCSGSDGRHSAPGAAAVPPAAFLEQLKTQCGEESGVCGKIWGVGDFVYKCRTCQRDPTSAICVNCFQHGNHEGHDYALIRAGGGVCDCGDPQAWKPHGFCRLHPGPEPLDVAVQRLPAPFAATARATLRSVLALVVRMVAIEARAQWPKQGARMRTRERTREVTPIQKTLGAIVDGTVKLFDYGNPLRVLVADKIKRAPAVADAVDACLLDSLLRLDVIFCEPLQRSLNALYFQLVTIPTYKETLIRFYIHHYGQLVNSMLEDEPCVLLELSVQLFTVPDLVARMIHEEALLEVLMQTFLSLLSKALTVDAMGLQAKVIDINQEVITKRKYWRVIGDLRYPLGQRAVARHLVFTSKLRLLWLGIISLLHTTDPHTRRTDAHVEMDNNHWTYAYTLELELSDLSRFFFACIYPHASSGALPPAPPGANSSDTPGAGGVGRNGGSGSGSGSGSGNGGGGGGDDDAAGGCTFAEACEVVRECVPQLRYLFSMCPEIGTRVPIDFVVSRAPMSLHFPSHRIFAGFLHRVVMHWQDASIEDILGDFAYPHFGAHLIEHPLRLQAWVSQVRLELWKRNGDMVFSQVILYAHQYHSTNLRHQDMLVLQTGMLLMSHDDFVASLLQRFELATFFEWDRHHPNMSRLRLRSVGFTLAHERGMAEDVLRLLFVLTKERSLSGKDEETCIREAIIHQLALGKQTFSALTSGIIQWYVDHADFKRLLDEVAEFTAPEGVQEGRYQLRPEWWAHVDMYYLSFSKRKMQVAEQQYQACMASQRKPGDDADKRPPRLRPHFTAPPTYPAYARLFTFLHSDAMRRLLTSVLRFAVTEDPRGSPALVEKTLHLLQYAMATVEENRAATAAQLAKDAQMAAATKASEPPSAAGSGAGGGAGGGAGAGAGGGGAGGTGGSSAAAAVSPPRSMTSSLASVLGSSPLGRFIPPLPTTPPAAGGTPPAAGTPPFDGWSSGSSGSSSPSLSPLSSDGMLDERPLLQVGNPGVYDVFEHIKFCEVGGESMLTLLVALFKMDAYKDVRDDVKAVLTSVQEHDAEQGGDDVVTQLLGVNLSEQKAEAERARRKAMMKARQAAIMAKFKKQQDTFSAVHAHELANIEDDDVMGDATRMVTSTAFNGRLLSGLSAYDMSGMPAECALCRDETLDMGEHPIGCVAHVQRSRVMTLTERQHRDSAMQRMREERDAMRTSLDAGTSGATLSTTPTFSSVSPVPQTPPMPSTSRDVGGKQVVTRDVEFVVQSREERDAAVRRYNDALKTSSYAEDVRRRRRRVLGRLGMRAALTGAGTGAADDMEAGGEGAEGGDDGDSSAAAVAAAVAEANNAAASRGGALPLDGVQVNFCGHQFHLDCFYTFFNAQVRNLHRDYLYLNLPEGEFFCPMCRQFSNAILPIIPEPLMEEVRTREAECVAETMGATRDVVAFEETLSGETYEAWLERSAGTHGVALRGAPVEETAVRNWDIFVGQLESQLVQVPVLKLDTEKLSAVRVWSAVASTLSHEEIASRGLGAFDYQFTAHKIKCLRHLIRLGFATHRNLPCEFADRYFRWLLPTEGGASPARQGDALAALLEPCEYVEDEMREDPNDDSHRRTLLRDLMLVHGANTAPVLACDLFTVLVVGVFSLGVRAQPQQLSHLVRTLHAAACVQACAYEASAVRHVSAARTRPSDDVADEWRTSLGVCDALGAEVGSVRSLYAHFVEQFGGATSDEAVRFAEAEEAVKMVVLPFLRRTVLFLQALLNLNPPVVPSECAPADEYDLLASALGLPVAVGDVGVGVGDGARQLALQRAWAAQLHAAACLDDGDAAIVPQCMPPVPFTLIALPSLFQRIFHDCMDLVVHAGYSEGGSDDDAMTKKVDPALCLLCGKVVVMSESASSQREAPVKAHARECGGGTCMFVQLKKSSVLMVFHNRVEQWDSPFLDEHGEQDASLQRGRALYFSRARYEQLRQFWVTHKVPQCVISRIQRPFR